MTGTSLLPTETDEIARAKPILRLNVHGEAVDVRCDLPALRQVIDDILGELIVDQWPVGFSPIEIHIEPYNADLIARLISMHAQREAVWSSTAELWRDGERLILIDDSWGICELNLLQRRCRSFVLPQGEADPIRTLEHALLVPMSHLLLSKGVGLIPAASIRHDGMGILLLAPFNLEPELRNIVQTGGTILSQRWTAIRDEGGCDLLRMPGRVEISPMPQLRSRASDDALAVGPSWIDLEHDAIDVARHARCDVVLIIEPGRRTHASLHMITGASAASALKHAWPMPDLPFGPRQSQWTARLFRQSAILQAELSRAPRAILRLLESLPTDLIKPALRPTVRPQSPVARAAVLS